MSNHKLGFYSAQGLKIKKKVNVFFNNKHQQGPSASGNWHFSAGERIKILFVQISTSKGQVLQATDISQQARR